MSEWPYILVGTICAIINGVMQPVFSIIFTKIIMVRYPLPFTFLCCFQPSSAKSDALRFCEFQIFKEEDKEIIRQKSSFFCILFAVMGVVTFLTMFLQVCITESR